MPTAESSGKKGRVTRVTRVHEDIDVVRVEREGDEEGPIAEVVDQRQTRSSISHRIRGKAIAALPASGGNAEDKAPTSESLDNQEAEELMLEAEHALHEPLKVGKTKVTRHQREERPNSLADKASADVLRSSQQQIEEVPAGTADEVAQDEPHIEEPDSSLRAREAPSNRSQSVGALTS